MCRKDITEPVDQIIQNALDNPEPLILSFKAKANSGDRAKSTDFYSIDSTEWYVEAALNHGSTYPNGTYGDFYMDTIIAPVAVIGGNVLSEDAIAAYNELEATFALFPVAEGDVVVAYDVYVVEEDAQFLLKTIRLSGTPEAKVLNTTYAANLSYHPYVVAGMPLGCVAPQPTQTADKAIQQRIRNHILVPVGPNQYLTNVQIWTLGGLTGAELDPLNFYVPITNYPNPNPETSITNTDYKIFKSQFISNTLEPCISNWEMSYLTQGTYDVMVDVRNTFCPTCQLIQCSITGMRDLWEWPINRWHNCVFTYDNYYYSTNG